MKRYVWSAFLSGAIATTAWADDDAPPIPSGEEYIPAVSSEEFVPAGEGYVPAASGEGYVPSVSGEGYVSDTLDFGYLHDGAGYGHMYAASRRGYVPVKYPQPPGAGSYYGGDHPVRPVYQQPLVPPVGNSCVAGAGACGGEMLGGCDECGDSLGCAGGDCGCGDCVRPLDMWVRLEYLSWWAEESRLPPLVTTATGAGTGILDDEDTVILFGGGRTDDGERSGGRFTIGAWLDDEHCDALEASFFMLDDSNTVFEVQSSGTPLIARPFFNVELQTNGVQTIASQGVSTGGVFISTDSEVEGAEIVLRRRIDNCCTRRVDFIYGYRYAGLDENLTIRDELTSVDPQSTVPVGTIVGGFDSFDARNQFHGGQLGLAMDVYRRRWTLGLVTKLALGNMREQVAISGNTVVTVPGLAPSVTAGGLLTQPSNIGSFVRDEFAVIPEFQLNLRYCLLPRVELSVGYTLVYFSDVVRPGDQIDLRVDPRQITDPANAAPFPAFTFVDSDFWLQGINAGIEFKF